MKDNYFDDKRAVLKQEIKVLLNKPLFQQDIANLRQKWGVPNRGLKSNEEDEDWYRQLEINSDKYMDQYQTGVGQEVAKLRGEGKFREAQEKIDQFNASTPINAFSKDIWDVVKRHKLSPKWFNGIKRYILFNDPDNLNLWFGVTIREGWENGLTQLSLEIDADTTLKDVKHIWPFVKKLQKRLAYRQKAKFQPIKNFDRDKRVYELTQQNKDWEEIANTIESEFGCCLNYNHINLIVKRYKKRYNTN